MTRPTTTPPPAPRRDPSILDHLTADQIVDAIVAATRETIADIRAAKAVEKDAA
jgi:hypothetical protein